jgi:hypothetical protein
VLPVFDRPLKARSDTQSSEHRLVTTKENHGFTQAAAAQNENFVCGVLCCNQLFIRRDQTQVINSFRSYTPGFGPINVLNEAARLLAGLVSGEDEPLAVRHPVNRVPIVFDVAACDSLGCAHSSWQQHRLSVANDRGRPFPIRRNPPAIPPPTESVATFACRVWRPYS